MNKHTRLAAGILVLVLMILIVATVSFSMNISKKSATAQNSASDTIVNPNGNEIIQGDDGLYGVADVAGNTILEPEWERLSFIGTEYLAAAKGNRVGVLNLDGNVAAPFVYRDVYALTDFYYLAELADSDKVVLYDHDFCAADAMLWDGSTWEKPLLTLNCGTDAFQYSLEKEILQLVRVELFRKTDAVSFTASAEKTDAAALMPEEWIRCADMMAEFLEMIKTQNFARISDLTGQENENAVLGGAVLQEEKAARVESALYLTVGQNDAGMPVLNWQAEVVLRGSENGAQTRILSVNMEKNNKQNWVITEAKYT